MAQTAQQYLELQQHKADGDFDNDGGLVFRGHLLTYLLTEGFSQATAESISCNLTVELSSGLWAAADLKKGARLMAVRIRKTKDSLESKGFSNGEQAARDMAKHFTFSW